MSDCGVSFKALYVVSLRRPTVASFFLIFILFTFRGVASDTRSVFICVMLGFQADYRRFPFFLPRYANFICSPSRRRFRHPIGLHLRFVGISGGLPPFPFYLPRYAIFC